MGDVKRRDVDSGWAWVALMASFFILALQGCYGMAVGYFQVGFLETFDGSKGFIALIGALSISGQSLLGPVAGIVTSLLTARVTVMIGGCLLAVSIFFASFSQDLSALFILFGILAGIGTGLSYTPAVTVVCIYFDRYRTVANGISMAAPGLGLLAFPHLLRLLIDTHGWRFAMGMYACLMAQICVLASFFFPHDPSQTPSCCCCRPRDQSRDHDPEVCEKLQKSPETLDQNGVENGKQDVNGKLLEPPEDRRLARLKEGHNPHIKDMVGSRTAMYMSEFGSVLLSNSVIWTMEEVTSLSLKERLKRLLVNRFVWVMCLNQFLLFAGFAMDVVFFPAFTKSVGIEFADLPTIYQVFGVTMIISRLSGGFVFTLIPSRHYLKVFFVLQACVAVLMVLLPVYGVSFATMCVYKLLLGMTYGPAFLLVTPILIQYLGLEELSVAFGVIMMSCGVAFITAPPIGGMMTDAVGSYGVVYYIAGTLIALSVLSLLLLLLIKDLSPLADREMSKSEPSPSSSSQTTNEKSPLSDSDDSPTNEKPPLIELTNGKPPFNDVELTNETSPMKVLAENATNGKLLLNGTGKHDMYVISDLEDLHNLMNSRHS